MTSARALAFVSVLLLIVSTAGCAAVAGIFKAGVWVGVVGAVLIIAVVVFLFSRLQR
jgi:hypothetical protein